MVLLCWSFWEITKIFQSGWRITFEYFYLDFVLGSRSLSFVYKTQLAFLLLGQCSHFILLQWFWNIKQYNFSIISDHHSDYLVLEIFSSHLEYVLIFSFRNSNYFMLTYNSDNSLFTHRPENIVLHRCIIMYYVLLTTSVYMWLMFICPSGLSGEWLWVRYYRFPPGQ